MKAGPLQSLVAFWEPVLDSSLDGVAAVDLAGKIVYCSASMRTMLALRPRQMSGGVSVFDVIRFPSDQAHPIQRVMDSGEAIRLDEAPATIGERKLRVSIRAVPAKVPKGGPPEWGAAGTLLGVVFQLRDTSGEILLQAKYHKIMDALAEKEDQVRKLEKKVRELREKVARGYVGG